MKTLFVLFLTLAPLFANAETVRYSNNEGCTVEETHTRNGILLYVTKGEHVENIGYAYDYSFGDFAYCATGMAEVHYYGGDGGLGLMISCSAHKNGHATTRGRVDISREARGNLEEIKFDGQVKSLFGWREDSKFECLNLKKN